jgi:hypothetical protein
MADRTSSSQSHRREIARGYWGGVTRRLARDPVSVGCRRMVILLIAHGRNLRTLARA